MTNRRDNYDQAMYKANSINSNLCYDSNNNIQNLQNNSHYNVMIKQGQVDGPNYRSAPPSEPSMSFCYYIIYILSLLGVVCTFPFSLLVIIKIVSEYERAVIFRLGRMVGAKGPGLFFILPCMDEIQRVDLRTISFDIPPQEVLTKDSVTIAVDAVVYYRVMNPVQAVIGVANASHSTRLLAQTTLRNQLGSFTLAGILSQRDDISNNMKSFLDNATDPWGIKVERVEIKDVRLPQQLQRAMAAEAEATREAQAKIIAARGEMDASKCLKEAADTISKSPGALQLRYLQTLNQISAEKNSTIVFPLPIDLLGAFKNSRSGGGGASGSTNNNRRQNSNETYKEDYSASTRNMAGLQGEKGETSTDNKTKIIIGLENNAENKLLAESLSKKNLGNFIEAIRTDL